MKYVATFLVLFAVYVLLAGFVVQELILGALISLILTIIIAKYVNYQIDFKLPYRFLVLVFVYIPVFIWQLLLATKPKNSSMEVPLKSSDRGTCRSLPSSLPFSP